MSRRTIISIATLVFLALIILASRHEIAHAWGLVGQLNLLILVLLIPVQLVVYFAAGEMIFSYLRAKGNIKKVSPFELIRMAWELNFVNHLFPSGGISGISYMGWRLGKLGVPASRATMSQAVRYVAGFSSYLTILVIAVVGITLDNGVNRFIILFSSVIACIIIFMIVFGTYIISSAERLSSFARWLAAAINNTVRRISFNRKQHTVDVAVIEKFFRDFHEDYVELRKDKKILIKPYLWGLLYNVADITLFMIGFWALGFVANPAAIAIAYGIASFAGFILITPGGAGGYEAIMISFISSAGTPGDIAIAGVLITRVILLMGTIITGYIFYQLTLLKYGKHTT
jgi:uncharacterized protein (TIRG00374 family)